MKRKKIGLIIGFIVFVSVLIFITIIYNSGNKNQEVLETEAEDVGIIRITDNSYKSEILNNDKIIVLDFYENMCPPCTAMIPTLINIAKSSEDIIVAMINLSADDTTNLTKKYEVTASPTIVILKNGQEIKKYIGATSEEIIMGVITQAMESIDEK